MREDAVVLSETLTRRTITMQQTAQTTVLLLRASLHNGRRGHTGAGEGGERGVFGFLAGMSITLVHLFKEGLCLLLVGE